MNTDCKCICTFNQKLSYDDLVNYADYHIKTKNLKLAKKIENIFKLYYKAWYIILIICLLASILYKNKIYMLMWIFCLAILFISVTFSKRKDTYFLLFIKFLAKRKNEKKITLFQDYILCECLVDDKKSYKILIKDIEEIEQTKHYCLIKSKNNKILLISLINQTSEIKLILDYLHKVCIKKFNYLKRG